MGSRRLLSTLLALLLALSMLSACGGGAAAGGGNNTAEGPTVPEVVGTGGEVSAAGMRLRKTEGTVAVQDDAGADVTPMENLNLYSGYDVASQAASYAWIDLDATKLTKLDENSEAAVMQDGKALTLDVLTGNLYFNITEPLAEDESLDIRTSTMVTGIRGTRGWVTQESVCLLEGTVTVTAGEQTVTVTAGQMARFTPDGTLETAPLPYQNMPAFVKAETPPPAGGATPTNYEELLATLDDLVYAEMVDFEQDGAPELLTVEIELTDDEAAGTLRNGYGSIRIQIYRQEADTVICLGGQIDSMSQEGSVSLVECDGRPYVRFYHGYKGLAGYKTDEDFISYLGPATPTAYGSPGWGTVDDIQIQFFKETGVTAYNCSSRPRQEDGLALSSGEWLFYSDLGYPTPEAAYEGITARYAPVRDLLSYHGPDVTVFAP